MGWEGKILDDWSENKVCLVRLYYNGYRRMKFAREATIGGNTNEGGHSKKKIIWMSDDEFDH